MVQYMILQNPLVLDFKNRFPGVRVFNDSIISFFGVHKANWLIPNVMEKYYTI